MRLAMVEKGGRRGTLASADGTTFRGAFEGDEHFPGDLDALIGQAQDLPALWTTLMSLPLVDLHEAKLLPPLQRSQKILCVGLNYADHAAESGTTAPSAPTIFARFTSSLVGHDAPMIRPRVSAMLDYEGEFVAVIGRGGRDIPKSEALNHVAAYALFNDGSIRDYQMATPQWTVGKNFDGTGAFGPWLVMADALPPGCAGLRISTRLNGQLMQNASTNDLVFDVADLVSFLSVAFTLAPGDLIVTGTPAGVGNARKPPIFMKPGDVCEVEMEGIGTLRNPIADQHA